MQKQSFEPLVHFLQNTFIYRKFISIFKAVKRNVVQLIVLEINIFKNF